MNPIITLEYIGDAIDNMRDARTTLAALRRTDPQVFALLQEEGILSTLDAITAKVAQLRGNVHAKTFSIA
ncbi:MAG: hypothetical protein ACN6OP_15210 [Pseudomonadales bacterium]